MAYLRLEELSRVNLNLNQEGKIVHTTGNFDLYLDTVQGSHSATGAATITIPATHNNVVALDYSIVDQSDNNLTATATFSGTGNRTVTFSPAPAATDTVYITFRKTPTVYNHTGAARMALVVEDGDYIDPKSDRVSIETSSTASNSDFGSTFIGVSL